MIDARQALQDVTVATLVGRRADTGLARVLAQRHPGRRLTVLQVGDQLDDQSAPLMRVSGKLFFQKPPELHRAIVGPCYSWTARGPLPRDSTRPVWDCRHDRVCALLSRRGIGAGATGRGNGRGVR